MEVDHGLEVLDVSEATGSPLDGHDLAVEPLGNGVGDWMATGADHVLDAFGRSSGRRRPPARGGCARTSFSDDRRIASASPASHTSKGFRGSPCRQCSGGVFRDGSGIGTEPTRIVQRPDQGVGIQKMPHSMHSVKSSSGASKSGAMYRTVPFMVPSWR